MDVLASRIVLGTGLICVAAGLLLLRPLAHRQRVPKTQTIPSPRQTLLPHLSAAEIASLPYPPDALPGSRDVPSPYGTTHVFEFGPATGERVLLLAGISTPCVALSRLATRLAARGHRVMLFDYFGRGWSDAPDPGDVDHDERLYLSQILFVLASSPVSWLGDAHAAEGGQGGFHVIGYSFGGGLAMSLASHVPRTVRSVTLVAPGGLMRRGGASWRTRVLYSRGILPERVLQYFVRRRFEPTAAATVGVAVAAIADADAIAAPQGEKDASAAEEESDSSVLDVGQQDDRGGSRDSQAQQQGRGDPFDDAVISPARPDVTVRAVMAWQLQHHAGFVPAMMSTIRYGPIHERYEEWGQVGASLAERREDKDRDKDKDRQRPGLPGLLGGKVMLRLGALDDIVRRDQIVPDMEEVLGKDAIDLVCLPHVGHEIGITHGDTIADLSIDFWEGL